MNDYLTPGYEDMELSTQRLIAAALDRGIKVEVLDRQTQWVRLSQGKKIELVRQGTETSADSYVTSLVLGDKAIQKQLLAEQGICVPLGKKYISAEAAIADFADYQVGQWVVKPTTANYGVGLTILPPEVDRVDFELAVNHAFTADESVLVEQFFAGIECRFLVIEGITRAVLHRVAANVEGDGIHSVSALVAQKNQDPERGEGYKTPLEKIKLEPTEAQVLAEQGLSFDSVPAPGQKVWLRKNSNISTGGDSLDYTDVVHPSYKALAEKAAQAVDAKICGVDIMLSDYTAAATDDNYTIIELNYNPVLYFHDFPYQGQNRNVAPYVLEVLGFE